MLVSLRLKPEVVRLLKQACKSERKTRTAVIHDALKQYLSPLRPPLGDVIREVLADCPEGLGIERLQPFAPEPRAKVR